MPQFAYLALDESGAERRGEVEANSVREVAEILKLRSYFVIEVAEGGGAGFFSGGLAGLAARLRTLSLGSLLPVRSANLVFFFQLMALMIRSGHTVTQSLDLAAGLVRGERLRKALRKISQAIVSGSTFATAAERENRIFSRLMTNLIRSGETSGQLEFALEQISDNITRTMDLRSQLIAAMAYPALVMLVAIGVLVYTLTRAVPKVASFFTAREAVLPWKIGALIDISDWLVTYGDDILIGMGTVLFLALAIYTTKRGKAVLDRVLLKLPIVGPTLRLSAMVRFGINMAMLLRSGLTVVESLGVLERVMDNTCHAEAMRTASERIQAGRSLAVGLEQRHIPPLVRHMAAVGERSGELEETMEEVGRFHRRRLDARVTAITTWAFPVLLLIVAATVGFIYLSIVEAILLSSQAFIG